MSPTFFGELKKCDIEIWLEKNYGEEMGFTEEDYLKENENIICNCASNAGKCRTEKHEKRFCYNFNVALYYAKKRNSLIEQLGINSFSMDSMIEGDNRRVIVDNYGIAFNGAEMALK